MATYLNKKILPHEFTGIPGSHGIAIGHAYVYDPSNFWIEERNIPADEIENEKNRFTDAIEKVTKDIKELKYKIETRVDEENARIFDPHIMLLHDPEVLKETNSLIESGKSAEFSFFRTTRKIIKAYKQTDDEYLRERIVDIRDIVRRVYVKLIGKDHQLFSDIDEPVIVVAPILTPSDTANMHSGKIKAFVTDSGGITSHATILARALGIPAVLSVKDASTGIHQGDLVIVDGENGKVYVNPSEDTIEKIHAEQKQLIKYRKALMELKDIPAKTIDGKRINLYANIEFYDEINAVLSNGAEGIGLFRSEFHYLINDTPPEEHDLFTSYFKVAEKLAPHPVVIRTFDLGGDKISHIIPSKPEDNPYLGWRAIRLSLSLRDLFKVQLRAIVRASSLRNVNILFPMISGIDELEKTLKILDEVKEEIKNEGTDYDPDLPVGVMIEVPSAAMIADHLAKRVDFFSIGTNDLVQYTVAVDRANDRIADLFDPFHPGVLRLIKRSVDAAHNAGIPVAVCGEMGGDPLATLLLIGFGMNSLSMIPSYIPSIKRIIRSFTIEQAQNLANKALEMETGIQVKKLIFDEFKKMNFESYLSL